MKKPYFSIRFLDGLKQTPKDYDFCITPVLKFGRLPKDCDYQVLANGYALGLEWGHWAIVFQVFWFKTPLTNTQNK